MITSEDIADTLRTEMATFDLGGACAANVVKKTVPFETIILDCMIAAGSDAFEMPTVFDAITYKHGKMICQYYRDTAFIESITLTAGGQSSDTRH